MSKAATFSLKLTSAELDALFNALIVAKIKASQEAVACAALQDEFPNLKALAEKYDNDALDRQSLIEKVLRAAPRQRSVKT